jgi:hypothetical protein
MVRQTPYVPTNFLRFTLSLIKGLFGLPLSLSTDPQVAREADMISGQHCEV